MLRALLLLVLFLILFAGIVLYVMQAPGLAIFTYGDITIELPLVVFVIGACIGFAVLYLLLRLLGLVFHAPTRIQAAQSRHRQRKADQDTRKGLTRFVSGDWAQSEKLLARAAEHAVSPYINYLWAAKAAQQSGNDGMRDHYLDQAKNCMTEKQQAALDILHAELLLGQGQPEQVLACIEPHSGKIRNNSKIAGLIAGAYAQLQDWQQLARIIPDLKKNQDVDPATRERIQESAVRGLLEAVRKGETAEDIEHLGARHKDIIEADDALAVAYAEALRDEGRLRAAAALAVDILNSRWNTGLVRLYGLLEHANATRALHQAEQWIKEHDQDATLHLTLGRLCKHAQLWGKAKSYLESSLSREPLPETYAELAALHEHLDETEDAHRCAKKGLELTARAP
ncbi:MAG: hypothetical protein OXC41_07075 [Gammaproteobacteria bacterium]|nr:hypothetical protein [Gammaproteobacteria bacterium]